MERQAPVEPTCHCMMEQMSLFKQLSLVTSPSISKCIDLMISFVSQRLNTFKGNNNCQTWKKKLPQPQSDNNHGIPAFLESGVHKTTRRSVTRTCSYTIKPDSFLLPISFQTQTPLLPLKFLFRETRFVFEGARMETHIGLEVQMSRKSGERGPRC
jgi:hypothetical protein